MARITKLAEGKHEQALDLIFGSDKPLTTQQVEFCMEAYEPQLDGQLIGKKGAFFTPLELAYVATQLSADPYDFKFYSTKPKCIDLCAGIGVLSYAFTNRDGRDYTSNMDLFCLEQVPRFVEIGKRLQPNATWVCGNVFDKALWDSMGVFDYGFSNPPFGSKKNKGRDTSWLEYNGRLELMVVETAAKFVDHTVFILPMESVHPQERFSYNSRKYSKDGYFQPAEPMPYLSDFLEIFGDKITWGGSGVFDTEFYADYWRETVPKVELCNITSNRLFQDTITKISEPPKSGSQYMFAF